MTKAKHPTYLQKRTVILGGQEKRARELMGQIMTLRNAKVRKRDEKKKAEQEKHKKKVEDGERKKQAREKREKKEFWEKEGRKRKADGTGDRRPRKKRIQYDEAD
jgi:ribosome biogenesis protein BMS1